MFKSKKILNLLMILYLLCVGVSLYFCAKAMFTVKILPARVVMYGLLVAALVLALFYGLRGGRKRDHRFYKSFCILYLIADGGCLFNAMLLLANFRNPPFLLVAALVSFLCVTTITVGKNLNPGGALTVCALNVAITPVATACSELLANSEVRLPPDMTIPPELMFSLFSLSLVLLIATMFKFNDKAVRAAKKREFIPGGTKKC